MGCFSGLTKYNRESELTHKINSYSIPLVIDVSNQGSLKANNIFIDITFPNELIVYDEDKKFEEPSNPLPFNPILMAQNKYERDQKAELTTTGKAEILKSFRLSNGIYPQNHFSDILQTPFRMPKITPANRRWWTRLNENKLTIKIDELLHTRRMTFDDEYRIAPLISGKHEIEVSVICEEYDDCHKQIIEIDI